MKLVLVTTHQNWWHKEPKITEQTIEAEDTDGLYAKAFRVFNGEKYANYTRTHFKDPSHDEPYGVWSSDVGNYVNNGGDMW